jgi:hypothetical protein
MATKRRLCHAHKHMLVADPKNEKRGDEVWCVVRLGVMLVRDAVCAALITHLPLIGRRETKTGTKTGQRAGTSSLHAALGPATTQKRHGATRCHTTPPPYTTVFPTTSCHFISLRGPLEVNPQILNE